MTRVTNVHDPPHFGQMERTDISAKKVPDFASTYSRPQYPHVIGLTVAGDVRHRVTPGGMSWLETREDLVEVLEAGARRRIIPAAPGVDRAALVGLFADLQMSKGVVMTRIATLLLCPAFLGALSFAQNPPEQPGTGGRMSQEQTACTGMHHKHDMSKMHEQMMKDMQSDLDSMRSNLRKMKDQIGKVSDRGTRDQLQLNIDMWQSLVDHMDKHMAAMKNMMGAP